MRPHPHPALRRAVVTGVAVALVGPALLVPARPASAAGETLRAVSVDTATAAADGFNAATVRISADLDLAGAPTTCTGRPARLAATPWVRLTRTAGATGIAVDDVVDVALTAAPGGPEANAGVWSGTWLAGSTRSGTWTVTEVGACTVSSPGGWSQDPRTVGLGASVTVEGTNAPRLAVAATPVVWGQRTTTVRATVTDARRRPIPGKVVVFGQGASCGTGSEGSALGTTGAAGVATRVLNPKVSMCAYLATSPTVPLRIDQAQALLVRRAVSPRFYFSSISGFPVNTVVLRGRSVVVSGSLAPRASLLGAGTAHRVALQIRSGRGWRTVATAVVAANGRFSVAARTTVRGIVTYRVLASSSRVMLPTPGRSLLVLVL